MFLYRVKVEELDASRMLLLKADIDRRTPELRANCPIREMSVIAGTDADHSELDIYLALDDFIGADQLKRLVGELNTLLDFEHNSSPALPRVSSELIHI